MALLEVTAGLGGMRGGHGSKEGLLAGSIENQGVQLGLVCDTFAVRCFTVGTPVSLGRDEGGGIIPILWRKGEETARPQTRNYNILELGFELQLRFFSVPQEGRVWAQQAQ